MKTYRRDGKLSSQPEIDISLDNPRNAQTYLKLKKDKKQNYKNETKIMKEKNSNDYFYI